LADRDSVQVENFDGGNSQSSGIDFSAGDSTYASSPLNDPSGGTASDKFLTRYTNIALNRDQFQRINATFKDFNDPPEVRFIENSIRVVQKAQTLDSLSLVEFFHPLQDFSDYEQQTFVINPRTTVNIDPGGFDTTNGNVSMIFCRAYYLPEATSDQKVLFWEYEGGPRNTMGQIMVLTGGVKNGSSGNGWSVNPFPEYSHTQPPLINLGGLSFTNPNDINVKLSIILAS